VCRLQITIHRQEITMKIKTKVRAGGSCRTLKTD
jgi:hypothetical protein